MNMIEGCDGCGAIDYEGELRDCHFCESTKCSHCDMEKNVGCPSCDGIEEDQDE